MNLKRLGYRFRCYITLQFVKYYSISTSEILEGNIDDVKIHLIEKDYYFKICKQSDPDLNAEFSKFIGDHLVKGQFIAELSDCYLLSSWSIPITSNGRIVVETSGHEQFVLYNIINNTDIKFLPELRFISYFLYLKLFHLRGLRLLQLTEMFKTPIFHLVPRHGYNCTPTKPAFYHWIFEDLPQLNQYFKAQSIYHNLKIYVGPVLEKWQDNTLNWLNIGRDSVISKKLPYCVKVNKLLFCRLPYSSASQYCFDPKGRTWVRDTIRNSLDKKFSNAQTPYSKKIIISRKYCSKRRILNEDQVKMFFIGKGFHFLYPEKITEIEKVMGCFYANEIISFPAGSATTNMIFCSPNSKITEIVPDCKLTFKIFFLLAQELGHDYKMIKARTVTSREDFREADLIVNVRQMKQMY